MRSADQDETVSQTKFRDHRLFHVDDPNGKAAGWYFEVRNGSPQGPFATRRFAEIVLAHYIDAARKIHPSRSTSGEYSVTANAG